MFEIRLLGQFDLRRDGDAVEIPSRPAQSLLAYLSLSAGIAHRREKLSGLLWPDASEANARSNLRHALWRIRQALSSPQGTPPSFLVADNISIAFHSDPDARVDAAVLDRPYDQRRPLHELVESVAAYGGELLPGFYDDWVILERERLRATLERKMQALLDRLRSEGRWAEVLEWGERWIALGHVPEPAYRALMEAHSSLGDPAGASAAYQRCVGSLRRELDVEPSEQTRSLHQQLSAGRKPPLPRAEPARPEHVDSPRAAVLALLERWHREDVDVLDLASLALVHAAQSNEPLDPPDVRLLIRSAVHHEVDLEPWLRHAGSPQVAAAALDEALRAYPKPQARMRIVQALRGLEGREAEEVLFRVATNDDAARVRSLAAVAVAERAGSEGVACALVEEVNATGGSAAMAALVAVADEIGLPKDLAPYPKVSLGVALAGCGRMRFEGAFG